MIAQSEVELSPEDLEIFEGLVDALEDDDEMCKVYHNVVNFIKLNKSVSKWRYFNNL